MLTQFCPRETGLLRDVGGYVPDMAHSPDRPTSDVNSIRNPIPGELGCDFPQRDRRGVNPIVSRRDIFRLQMSAESRPMEILPPGPSIEDKVRLGQATNLPFVD